jgi:tetratricopeptide (TPR) repeat protein
MSSVLAALVAAMLFFNSCSNAPPRSQVVDPQRLAEANRLILAENFGAAVAVLQPLVPDHPRDSKLLSILGECYWRLGEYTTALTHFESSLRIDYSDYRTHLLLAQMLMENGKTGRALTEFQLATQFGSHQALPFYNYGLALYKLNRQDDAFEQWRHAYRLESDNPVYAGAMGMAYAGIDDGEALAYFEKAAALGKNDHLFLHNFGLLLDRLGEFRRAEEKYRGAIDQSPANREYLFSLAALHMKQAAYGEALPLWNDLAAMEPANKTYRTYQAKSNLELGRFNDAVEALEEVALSWENEGGQPHGRSGHTPPLDQAFDIVAMAYRGMENREESLRYIEKAVALAPGSAAHLNNYGVILAENGMIAKAIEQWERVLEIDPANAVARQNLSAYKQNR